MDLAHLAARLDATNLKADAPENAIKGLCLEAAKARYAAVCVYPDSVAFCSQALRGSAVATCTVANFPHGRSAIEAVASEIEQAALAGAQELDFVLPYHELVAGLDSQVAGKVATLCQQIRSAKMLSKVIVETCYLNREQKTTALRLCEDAGADFIKTSTGFGPAGAQVEDVALFAKERRGSIRIKASGGIRTLSQALALIDAGADRLGVSGARDLLQACRGD